MKLFTRPTKAHDCEWRSWAESMAAELERVREFAPFEDPDTSLGNAALLQRETVKLAARYGRCATPFAVALVDVACSGGGETELPGEIRIHVAHALISVARVEDSVGSLGGDRYAALLGECTLSGARAFAERVGRTIATLELYTNGPRLFLTAAVGVAEWQQGMGSFADLATAARADLDRASAAREAQCAEWESRPASSATVHRA